MEKQPQSTALPVVASPTTAEYKSEPCSADTSSPFLLQTPSKASYSSLHSIPRVSFSAKALMIVPLLVHCLGSLAIVAALVVYLDPHPLYTERSPKTTLANGTKIVEQPNHYNILQSDVVTILSGALMVLRWVAAAWAGPLCWRALFLLAEKRGVRRQDIKWITSTGFLPPSRHLRHLPTLLISIILICSLVPFPASPLLTGSITWVPLNRTLDDSSFPINYSTRYRGKLSQVTEITQGRNIGFNRGYMAHFQSRIVRMYNLAESQSSGEYDFKRVTDSIANLSIGSAVQDILMPYMEIKNIEWSKEPEDDILGILHDMHSKNEPASLLPMLTQPGAAALVATPGTVPNVLRLLINVQRDHSADRDYIWGQSCNDRNSRLVVPENSNIHYFDLEFNFEWRNENHRFSSCFAYAKVTLIAGAANCPMCRVVSYSTVQNETDLERVTAEPPDSVPDLTYFSLKEMPLLLPILTPFKDSLPNPVTDGLEAYARAVLIRSYSAVWTAWNDMTSYDSPALNLTYQPAYPTLTGKVNKPRAFTWLALQLSATLAGLLFLCLQGASRNPLLTDTRMLAFDLDSTEVSIPNSSTRSKKEDQEMLKFEWSGDRWKAVVKRRKIVTEDE